MEYESFRPLDGAHDRLSTLILAGSLALALACIGCGFDRRASFESSARIQPLQAQLAMEHAQGMARGYWQEHGGRFNSALPVVILCTSEDNLIETANAGRLPSQTLVGKRDGLEAWAFTNMATGRIYLRDAASYDVLLHEAGHWYLNLNCDEADKFAAWALRQRLKKFPILEK